MARRDLSGRTTRTQRPQESKGPSAFLSPALSSAFSASAATAFAPSCGSSSTVRLSPSPALNAWMISWQRSQTSFRLGSSRSPPSSFAIWKTSFNKSSNSCCSSGVAFWPWTMPCLLSSFSRPCLKFNSNTWQPSLPKRAQDSKPVPKVTEISVFPLEPSTAKNHFRRGSSSAFMSSSVRRSSKRAASMLMQLSTSKPRYSLRNCTAYSSTGSVM
mmetsp:Transcript_9571/g.17144  ORF Transcript_9571/g.17144 Transcript_9571/m.17144 type:complete len:215 (-) Transcript_9571:1076-1720(-)